MDKNTLAAECRSSSVNADITTYGYPRGDPTCRLTICELYRGVNIWVNDMHAYSAPSDPQEGERCLKFNYSIENVCEAQLSENRYVYVGEGTLSVDLNKAQECFVFPKGSYLGLEISIDTTVAADLSFFSDFGIDIDAICERLRGQKGTFLGCPPAEWQNAARLTAKRMLSGDITLGELRLRVLELIHPYAAGKIPSMENVTYLTRGQKEIALKCAELLRSDLSARITVEQLAERFGVSPSTLKKYFSHVFGMPISAYVKNERMEQAAAALAGTRKSVQDVAAEAGYQHQGKFGAAFKEKYGVTPLEYRRVSNISQVNGGKKK